MQNELFNYECFFLIQLHLNFIVLEHRVVHHYFNTRLEIHLLAGFSLIPEVYIDVNLAVFFMFMTMFTSQSRCCPPYLIKFTNVLSGLLKLSSSEWSHLVATSRDFRIE